MISTQTIIKTMEQFMENPDLIQDLVSFFQADLDFDEDLGQGDLEILGEMVRTGEAIAWSDLTRGSIGHGYSYHPLNLIMCLMCEQKIP